MRLKEMLRKAMSLALSLGMVGSMISGLTIGSIAGVSKEYEVYADGILSKKFVYTLENNIKWTDKGNYDTSWYNVNENEYYISTATGLAGLAAIVNGHTLAEDEISFAGKTIYLTNDVDLAGYEWESIGTEDRPFEGNFNGNGHSVNNMRINERYMVIFHGYETYHNDTGFFGYINGYKNMMNNSQGIDSNYCSRYNGSEISNLFIENCDVTGGYYTGGLVGRACLGTVFYNCGVSGTVRAVGEAGSFAGYLNGSYITNSYSTADFYGEYVDSSFPTGGFVGSITGSKICNSYYAGKILDSVYGLVVGVVDDSGIENFYYKDIDNSKENSENDYIGFYYGLHANGFINMSTLSKENFSNELIQGLNPGVEGYEPKRIYIKRKEFKVVDGKNNGWPVLNYDDGNKLIAVAGLNYSYINVGKEVTIYTDVIGGDGNYKYKYVVHNLENNNWYTLKDYCSDKTYTTKISSAGNKEFVVSVMDGNGKVTNTDRVQLKAESNELEAFLEVNNSSLTVNANVGDSVTLSANAHGGEGGYKYKYVVHNLDTNTWYTLKDYTDSCEYVAKVSSAGNKEFVVSVMDESGKKVATNKIAIKVSGFSGNLEINDSLNPKNISVGEQIKMAVTANGGSGEYTYKYVVHNLDTNIWYTLKDYNSNNEYFTKISSAGNKEFVVSIKDKNGLVVATNKIIVTVGANS